MNSLHAHNDESNNDLDILSIRLEMRQTGLDNAFIFSLMKYCQSYEGIQDLMEMWMQETDIKEKGEIIADLQDILDDIHDIPETQKEQPFLHFDNLDAIRKDVIEFKKSLREEVDRQGGISELARKTGIPQPSLSRFFTSPSMPRRTTLYKIAKALNLPDSAVGFKWTTH